MLDWKASTSQEIIWLPIIISDMYDIETMYDMPHDKYRR